MSDMGMIAFGALLFAGGLALMWEGLGMDRRAEMPAPTRRVYLLLWQDPAEAPGEVQHKRFDPAQYGGSPERALDDAWHFAHAVQASGGRAIRVRSYEVCFRPALRIVRGSEDQAEDGRNEWGAGDTGAPGRE